MGNERNKGREKNPNKAGMYFSLIICVVALAIGAFSAINRRNELYNSNDTTTKPVVEIGKAVTSVTKSTAKITEATTTSAATTAEKTVPQSTSSEISANHFTLPVGGTIDKKFDAKKLQYSETYKDWRLHLGIDISAKKGTQVTSAGKGRVEKVYNDNVLGATAEINHGNGIVCIYSGLKDIIVEKNDIVEIGQRIGSIGDIPSEIVESTHLHFAVKKDGGFADPLETLDIK